MTTSRRGRNDEPGGYHAERLDDVSTRVARMEGRMDSMATKEDVANAKVYLLLAAAGILVAIGTGVVSIIVRFV